MNNSLVLYTSPNCRNETNELKDFLLQGGFAFEEKTVLVVPAALKRKWGPQASLPVLRYGEDHWIAAHDHESLRELYVNQLLSPTQQQQQSPKVTTTRTHTPKEICFSPNMNNHRQKFHVPSFQTDEMSTASTIEIEFVPSNLDACFKAVEEEEEEEDSEDSSEDDDDHSGEFMTEMSVMHREDSDDDATLVATPHRASYAASNDMPPIPVLIRQLLQVLEHETYKDRQGQCHYYIKGRDAVRMLRAHLETETQELSDFEAIAYGKKLLQLQVLQNYTPEEDEFEKCLLVLQPFWTPQVLNSFMIWPEDQDSADTPEDILRRLSKQMDALDAMTEKNETLWLDFEVAVCELQMVEFPHESPEFALNLYNLIVRHALYKTGRQEWPTSLETLEKLWQSIGYNVGSEWIDLMTLQTMLLGQQKRVEKNRKVMNRLLRKGRRGESYDGFSPCYYNSAALDPRYIFAMTWGCQSSPIVSTLCCDLDESLQQAAENYCQKHVKISKHRVVLPTLLSWYCKSFGATHATQVFKRIRSFLTPEQDRIIKKYKLRNQQFEVVFADASHFKWAPRLFGQEEISDTDEDPSQSTTSENFHDAYISSHRRRVDQLRALRPASSSNFREGETDTGCSSDLWGELIDEEPPSEKDYDDTFDYNEEEGMQTESESLLDDFDAFYERGQLKRGKSLYLTMRREVSALTLDIAFQDEPGFQRL